MQEFTNRSEKKRWLLLLLAAVILLCAGVLYAWSILNKPFELAGMPSERISFAYTLALCCFCIGGLISGLLNGKLSIRLRMLIAAVLSCAGFLMCSFYQGQDLLVVLGYGALCGLGIGIVYNVVIAATTAWFPDQKGLCTGVMMMAFGFTGLLIGSTIGGSFADEDQWRTAFRVIGIALFAMFALGGLILRVPAVKRSGLRGSDTDISSSQMVRRLDFWKLFVFFVLFAAVGSTAIGFGRNYFESVGLTAETAVTIAGLLSIFNGLGRIVSGRLYDKAGLRATQLITSAVVITASGLSLLASIAQISWLGVIGLCLCAFSYGFSPTVSAACVSAYYGDRYFALNFPILNLVLIPASFMSTLAGKLRAAAGGYTIIFIVLTVASCIGLIINLTLKKKAE